MREAYNFDLLSTLFDNEGKQLTAFEMAQSTKRDRYKLIPTLMEMENYGLIESDSSGFDSTWTITPKGCDCLRGLVLS